LLISIELEARRALGYHRSGSGGAMKSRRSSRIVPRVVFHVACAAVVPVAAGGGCYSASDGDNDSRGGSAGTDIVVLAMGAFGNMGGATAGSGGNGGSAGTDIIVLAMGAFGGVGAAAGSGGEGGADIVVLAIGGFAGNGGAGGAAGNGGAGGA
jgi:hypothetical protein